MLQSVAGGAGCQALTTLALNAGSTSLKFGLFDGDSEALLAGEIDWSGGNRRQAVLMLRPRHGAAQSFTVAVEEDSAAAAIAISASAQAATAVGARPVGVVGHRVVHGGAEFWQSARIDAQVKAAIARLGALAPLHNPAALSAIHAAETAQPGVPQVAVFDTAFFARLPLSAIVYPLPFEWYADWGIRRFGFHGISHAYCAARAAEILERAPSALRLVICHLGGGCSAAAVLGGQAIATTMGYSPLDGLMMGTRCGSIDPGILLHLQRQFGLSVAELDHRLNHDSGLLGISGLSPDLAAIETAAAQGNPRAKLAFDLFADRVRSAVGALVATLGGLDALVFTDRIGESSPTLRASVCERLGFMGLRLDDAANQVARPDADIASSDSPARILVVRSREELMIAREARRALQSQSANAGQGHEVTRHFAVVPEREWRHIPPPA